MVKARLSLVGRIFIVYHALLSSLWNFIYYYMYWFQKCSFQNSDTSPELPLVRIKIHPCPQVSWGDCIIQRKCGGLSITNPESTLYALMSKWFIMVMLHGNSNLQFLLRFRKKVTYNHPLT